MPTAHTSVFISYNHSDARWLDLLLTHLHPLKRNHKIDVFSDRDLQKGERWRLRLRRELARAKVGILLVSPEFLRSDFIHTDELPPLLAAAEAGGTVILSLMVRHCSLFDSPLTKRQMMNGPDRPLSGMTITQRDREMVKLYSELIKIFGLMPTQATRPARRKATRIVAKSATAAKKATSAKKSVTTKSSLTVKAGPKPKPVAKRKVAAKKPMAATVAVKSKPSPKPATPAKRKTGSTASSTVASKKPASLKASAKKVPTRKTPARPITK